MVIKGQVLADTLIAHYQGPPSKIDESRLVELFGDSSIGEQFCAHKEGPLS